MARRRPHSDTPLDQKQQELAQRESDLRKQMEDLQRMIEEAPRVAEEKTRRRTRRAASARDRGRNRLDVTMALQDKRFGEYAAQNRRPARALRKQRSEGRLLFIVLVIALSDRDHLDRDAFAFLVAMKNSDPPEAERKVALAAEVVRPTARRLPVARRAGGRS